MMPLQRRRFIGTLLPFAALPLSSAGAAITPIRRVGGSHLKTSLNVYSFLELLNANAKDSSTGIDLTGLCEFCATHGFDGIDVTGYFFRGYPEIPDDARIFEVKRRAFDLGLGISGTGVRNDFVTADKTVRAAGVAHVKRWVEVAAKLGAPTLRVFADSQPPFRNWREASNGAGRGEIESWIAEALRECAEHAAKSGIILAVQNHGDFINTGAEHLDLLRRVDHPNCGALVDTGKYLTADPYADIAMTAPYAVNWQIKETTGSTTDSPRTDLGRLLKIIRRSGYRGYLPIETLAMKRPGYDSFMEVPKMLGELNEAIAATASIAPDKQNP